MIENENYEMTNEEFENAMKDNGKVVVEYIKVQFKEKYSDTVYNGDSYLYKKPVDMNLRRGDYVIVETRYGIALALVSEVGIKKDDCDCISSVCDNIEFKSKIVQKVDYENYLDNIKRLARIKELKSKFNTYSKKVDEIARYTTVAAMFPELAGDLNELKSLLGGLYE